MDETQAEIVKGFDAKRREMLTWFNEIVQTGALTKEQMEDEIEATATAMSGLVACGGSNGE